MASLMILNLNQTQSQASSDQLTATANHATPSPITSANSGKRNSYCNSLHPTPAPTAQHQTPAATQTTKASPFDYEKSASLEVKLVKTRKDLMEEKQENERFISTTSLSIGNTETTQADNNYNKFGGFKKSSASSTSSNTETLDKANKKIKYHYKLNRSNFYYIFFNSASIIYFHYLQV